MTKWNLAKSHDLIVLCLFQLSLFCILLEYIKIQQLIKIVEQIVNGSS
jgi:hypothetical protein